MADVLKYRIAGPTSSDTEILVSETVSTNLVDSGTTSIQLTMSLDNLAVVPGEVRGWFADGVNFNGCLLYTSPSPRDSLSSRMPSSA